MASNNLKVTLKSRTDKDKRTFYVGKVKFPGMIDATKGLTFLVFTSDEGEEELQITEMSDKNVDSHED